MLIWLVSALINSTSLSSFSLQTVSVLGSFGGLILILFDNILCKNLVVLDVSFALSSILERYKLDQNKSTIILHYNVYMYCKIRSKKDKSRRAVW